MVLTHMGPRYSYCLKVKIITKLYVTLFFEGKLLQTVQRRKLRSIYDQEGVVKFHDKNYFMELVRADPEIDYHGDVGKLSLVQNKNVLGLAMTVFNLRPIFSVD